MSAKSTGIPLKVTDSTTGTNSTPDVKPKLCPVILTSVTFGVPLVGESHDDGGRVLKPENVYAQRAIQLGAVPCCHNDGTYA